ncbi:MAG TPA: hypothetical protein VGR06_11770 [Actinophytocola sp.]|uniref:hypothetical protein n=1 Tax=Actinophytocola sp. TaxID=1872138 RepID=UPI002E033A01|nr:hypothetical protein [Actinophytocola sp.]
MDGDRVGREYLSHLTDADLRLLASVSGVRVDAAELRRDPGRVMELFEHPRVFGAVFGEAAASSGLIAVSPFLAFAVLVHRAAAALAAMTHLPERSGPRQRIPVFDAPQLRDFLDAPQRRLFLAELLASFTRVASGRYQVRGSGGRVRIRQYNELDPVRLAGLLDAVPTAEQPGVYRRLGDVALFLTGVFPDYTTTNAFGPVQVERLLRVATGPVDRSEHPGAAPAVDLLERLGTNWYRTAYRLTPTRTARLTVVAEVAERFSHARRVLNHIADRYLFPSTNPWLARPSG